MCKNRILCSNRWTGGTAEAHVPAISEYTEDSRPERRPGLQTAAARTDTEVRRARYDSADHAELAD